MSLLNEMLKDLNKNPSKRTGSIIFSSREISGVERLIPYLPWCIFILLVIGLFTLFQMNRVKSTTSELANSSFESQLTPSVLAQIPDFTKVPEELADELPPVNEKLVSYSREDWYEEHINSALEAIQEGNDQRAIDILSLVITEFPTSVEARENLAMLYISHNELSNAYEVLDDGLNREPRNVRLIAIKARLLAEQGSNSAALALLEQFNPDINTLPDYYALMAAVLESLGRSNEAGSLYQALTRVDPNNGQYWLGLGMALEHKHANLQAIEAYRRASESDGSRATIRAFAENRLRTLQG